jgi:hypothetical protein
LQYLGENPISKYLLVDHRVYLNGKIPWISIHDLSQRTSATGTPRPGNDAQVFTALQTSEFFNVLRPDILDADRNDLYEIKPVRGASAGPAQLQKYLDLLNLSATEVPTWMGGGTRRWQAGPWQPELQYRPDPSELVCVYPDAVPGVLLYDLLWCPPKDEDEPEDEHKEDRPPIFPPPLVWPTKPPSEPASKGNGVPEKGNGVPEKGNGVPEKGNGVPEKGNGKPGKRPPSQPDQPTLRWPEGAFWDFLGKAIIAAGVLALMFGGIWGKIGGWLGALARALGFSIGMGTAMAVGSADTPDAPPEIVDDGEPSPDLPPVIVDDGTPSPDAPSVIAGETTSPDVSAPGHTSVPPSQPPTQSKGKPKAPPGAQTTTAPSHGRKHSKRSRKHKHKAQKAAPMIKLKRIEGLTVESVSPGKTFLAWIFKEGTDANGLARLEVTNTTVSGKTTTVEFKVLEEAWCAKGSCSTTKGGHRYSITSPDPEGDSQPGFIGILEKGALQTFLPNVADVLFREAEARGMKAEARKYKELAQRMREAAHHR